MMWSRPQRHEGPASGEGEQSYLASAADLMIGLLFVFIIMVAFLALQKKAEQEAREGDRDTLDDDTPVHSFGTLMAELATIVRNTCRTPQAAKSVPTFEVLTSPNAKQQRAIELLRQIKV